MYLIAFGTGSYSLLPGGLPLPSTTRKERDRLCTSFRKRYRDLSGQFVWRPILRLPSDVSKQTGSGRTGVDELHRLSTRTLHERSRPLDLLPFFVVVKDGIRKIKDSLIRVKEEGSLKEIVPIKFRNLL